MTAEQLEDLLGKVTQGDWAITGQPDKVCAEGYTKQGAAKVIVEVKEKAWMTASEQFSNASLIALAPSLARRVIAGEKLYRALSLAAHDQIDFDIVCRDYVSQTDDDGKIRMRKMRADAVSDRLEITRDALTAYREASK